MSWVIRRQFKKIQTVGEKMSTQKSKSLENRSEKEQERSGWEWWHCLDKHSTVECKHKKVPQQNCRFMF